MRRGMNGGGIDGRRRREGTTRGDILRAAWSKGDVYLGRGSAVAA